MERQAFTDADVEAKAGVIYPGFHSGLAAIDPNAYAAGLRVAKDQLRREWLDRMGDKAVLTEE